MLINLSAIVVAFIVCVPSAAIGFGVWWIQKSIEHRDKKQEEERTARQQEVDEREKLRQDNELMTLKCVMASLDLAEATAKAVQKIPGAHCNGDMHEALERAAQVKSEHQEFIERAGIQRIYRRRAAQG
jgi:hypothetical protein